jgi:DNA-binding MarR family transcriptional regulator
VDPEVMRGLEDAPLPRLLSVAGHLTRQRWSRLAGEEPGLTSAGVSVLLALGHSGDGPPERGGPGRATSRELARRCWVRPATLTGVVDTLVRAGLVARERHDGDRRQVWITLTSAGRERYREIGRRIQQEFIPTRVEQDPARAAVIREYLIELITTYQDGGSVQDDSGRRAGPRQAIPETAGERRRRPVVRRSHG